MNRQPGDPAWLSVVTVVSFGRGILVNRGSCHGIPVFYGDQLETAVFDGRTRRVCWYSLANFNLRARNREAIHAMGFATDQGIDQIAQRTLA